MNHKANTKNELAKTFIFECLTARRKNGDLDVARNLARQPDFDWDLILAVADEELVSPLLHEILQREQIIPPSAAEMLARKQDYTARRNLFLLHELGQTLSLFHDAGLDVIVLKGAALIETIYKNISVRPMRDLDLLIRHEQLQEAVELLVPLGYRQTSVISRESYPVALEKPAIEPVILELHQSLFHSLYYQQQLSMDWFWQTACSTKTASQAMTVLGPEAQILHLCGHLTYHHYHESQLLWRNDLAEFITAKQEQISWAYLIDKAQTFQLILPSRQILIAVARDWGAPIPEEVLEDLQSLEVSAAEMRAFTLSTAVKQSEGQGYWRRLKEITGWRKRVGYVVKWLFPTPASLRSRYHISRPLLLPLAYPYHWWVGARLAIEGLFARRSRE